MSSSVVLHSIDRDEIISRETSAWRNDLQARLADHERLVTLYGWPDGTSVVVTAVLERAPGKLSVLRTTLDPRRGYYSLTREFPFAHIFERELHEQYGIHLEGHPWLKPVRFESRSPDEMKQFPFYKIEGKEVHEVSVGPIHAGVIEPGVFRFMCVGETVHHLEVQLGYQHRGVERRLLDGDARRLAPLVETIAGDSSIAHAWAYCAAIETITNTVIPPPLEAARAIMLELERVAMHLATLSGLSADVGFLQGSSTYSRLRTTAINTTMRLCGSRFGRGAIRPGGSGIKLDRAAFLAIAKNVAEIQKDIRIINDCFLDARTVQHRFRGVGTLRQDQAIELGLVGLAARASGVSIDQRTAAVGAYDSIPMPLSTHSDGDCWARIAVRIDEISHSLAWIVSALERFSESEPVRTQLPELNPGRLVVAVAEGFRGEVVHCLESDSFGGLRHYKVQDPSLRNWLGLAVGMRENEISDFPICNKSFDLSYCGNDL